MRRLSGMDAGFLNLESPLQPMHTMALAILQPARGAGGMPIPVRMDDLRRHMASRLDELPQFRARLQWVPLGLNHPVLIEDPEFDLDRHLGQATLPAPGGPDELDRFYASLAERPLDRRHPLWRLTVVDGLDGGQGGQPGRVGALDDDGGQMVIALDHLQVVFGHQPVRHRLGGLRRRRLGPPFHLMLDGLRGLTTAYRLARNRWRRLRAPLGLTLDGLGGLSAAPWLANR